MPASLLRALVVEDDLSWQQILGEILSDSGLAVDTAQNLEDAVQLLKAQTHRLAVVDLSLSPKDHNDQEGLRVLDAVRKLDPNCRTILLTGFATVELAVASLTDYGAFTFLRKENFQRAQFREIIGRVLVSAPGQKARILSSAETSFRESDRAQEDAGRTKEKALVVEDDAGWRSILEELVQDAGYQVRACSSYGDAIGHLRRGNFALAVIDLSLKGPGGVRSKTKAANEHLDGYQLLAVTHSRNIPTVVVSGAGEPELIRKTYSDYAIAAYIEKQTFDRALFRRMLEEAHLAYHSRNELGALTEREREVLELLAQGLTNKEIGEKLVITTNTVKRHLKAIFEKLNVHTRSAATAKITGAK